ncbi:unnamed protein product [Adineta steineri]|uniref:Uncharacterized protein n=1 Tax=Adineta steineri TaxID=433720 RepID=A0A818QBV6_9BILA|nr:unnamed protein product [Adineta steineri]CAF1339934.1 unnamed protein product [Adineta steineri]CAF3614360.1 unnamed protein product [Adineta steineri]CAF3638370.1 unnamed protein product [Adineta steineri]CAF3798487.1 unnamed protein product [Adineta steineri]
MSQRQSEGFIIQNVNQQGEEQMIPISNTTETLIINDTPSYSEKQHIDRSGLKSIFTNILLVFGLLILIILAICLFILVEMFLPGRYNRPSAYTQYGFRDGFTHTARNTIYFASFMLFLGVIFILICCCYQYVALCSKRNRSSNTEL